MGKYKYGKPDEEISLDTFKQKLEASGLSQRKKAYLILLYWLGCRKSEPLVLRKEDLELKDNNLYVSINYRRNKDGEIILFSRAKRGQAGGPSELNLNLYGVPLVVEVWRRTKRNRKVFGFSDDTGYRAVQKLFPRKTPHHFRYNRITKLRKKLGDTLTIDEIKSFTGIRRDTTIQDYGLKTRAGIHKVAQQLD